MIVRLMNEGQFRVDDDVRRRLDVLDEEAVTALEQDDEAALDAALELMWQLVRAEGEPLSLDDLHPSDVLIPPPDLTLEETRALFSDQGLIPDLPA
jgi:hypothetical protein